MNLKKSLNKKRIRRAIRVRAKIFGTAKKPRLAVSRSNRFVYAQLIDDEKSHTLAHASSREVVKPRRPKGVGAPTVASEEKKSKGELSKFVGELLAKRALELGIKAAVFDRRNYKYHGRVKSLAEGARNGGLKI
ncbi:MAG: 50S ribosomal protein L18 [bacterium]|nr:50S ribosomal protein L18 [bacterium]